MDSNDGRTVSRRGIVGGAGIGLAAAAAAVTPAFAGGTSGVAWMLSLQCISTVINNDHSGVTECDSEAMV